MAKMVNCEFLVPLASSLVTLVLCPLIAHAVSVAGKIVAFAMAAVEFLARDDTVVGCSILDDDDDNPPRGLQHPPHSEEPPVVLLTCGDAAAVTSWLGLPRWTCSGGSSECRACRAAEVVAQLMAAGVGGVSVSVSESEQELEDVGPSAGILIHYGYR